MCSEYRNPIKTTNVIMKRERIFSEDTYISIYLFIYLWFLKQKANKVNAKCITKERKTRPHRGEAGSPQHNTPTLAKNTYKFCVFTLFLKLEVTIFTIHNCWPHETISKLIQTLGNVCGAGSAHHY